MSAGEIRFLGDLQRLRPEPGDVFVLKAEGRISNEAREALRASWAAAMPGQKVLVLDGSMSLGVIADPDRTTRLVEALEFAALTVSSEWPERCQEIVARARDALRGKGR